MVPTPPEQKKKRAAAKPRSSRQKALLTASALVEKKAQDTVVLDLRKLTVVTDFFVITTATSATHLRALAEEVETRLKQRGLKPASVQGVREGHWALIDLGDVMVHIFAEFERGFYDLERLWGDAPRTEVA